MLTEQDIIKAFRVGFGFDDEAPFISRFRDGQGLIFGIGETIAEYWAAFEVCYMAGLFSDEITDATSRQNALTSLSRGAYLFFQSRCRDLNAAQGVPIEARSNVFIQFAGADRMTIQSPNYRYPNFGMRLEGQAVTPGREQFFERFKQSGYRMDKIVVEDMWKGIEKDWQGNGVGFERRRQGRERIIGGDLTSLRQYMVRRACKFLIYDEIRERDGHIFYALDGIVMNDVIARNYRPLHGRGPKVPVCTSELREIFRMWNYLKDRVTFYEHLQPVPAPWHTLDILQLAGWSNYALQRVTKLLASPMCIDQHFFQQALADMQARLLVNDHRGVIDRYHLIPHHCLPKRYLPTD